MNIWKLAHLKGSKCICRISERRINFDSRLVAEEVSLPEVKQTEFTLPDLIKACIPAPEFPGGSDGNESACNAGDPDSTPGSERSPAEGNGSPLQDSHPENPMDSGAWRTPVHGATESRHDWATNARLIPAPSQHLYFLFFGNLLCPDFISHWD